ncbi:MAG: GTPase-activating protein S13, partial [Marteilia pararefringens]
MALNVYYNLIATCSLDKTIRIFDCSDSNSFTHLETLSDGHDAEICQVAWSHPFAGNFLASCGMDHRVVIWRPSDDNQMLDLSGEAHDLPESKQNATPSGWKIHLLYDKFEASVNSIDFAPYQAGTRLIAVGAERKIVILTLTSENQWIPSEIIDNESVSLGMFSVNWAPASSSLVRIHDETSGQPSIQMISRFAV